MTLDADIDELTNEIGKALAMARRLDLAVCAHILSMALMEAIEAVDRRHDPEPHTS
ncbi:MAG: hypothetical protein ABWY14_21135 [Tardiphaga sp.]